MEVAKAGWSAQCQHDTDVLFRKQHGWPGWQTYDMRWAALLLRTYGLRQAALSVVRRHGCGAVMKAREAAAG